MAAAKRDKLNSNDLSDLLELATSAQALSYSPYSKFRVGAALQTSSGARFSGCNIENSSFGLSICAERVAAFKAISEPSTLFTALALIGPENQCITPCGACLQVLAEFSDELVIVRRDGPNVVVHKLTDLLPAHFKLLEPQ